MAWVEKGTGLSIRCGLCRDAAFVMRAFIGRAVVAGERRNARERIWGWTARAHVILNGEVEG